MGGGTSTGTVIAVEQRGQLNVVPARSSLNVNRVLHSEQIRTMDIGADLTSIV